MRTNHSHFLNHSDFLFYFLHHGKDGGDKDASHRVDLDEDKSLSNLDEGGGFPQYNSQPVVGNHTRLHKSKQSVKLRCNYTKSK